MDINLRMGMIVLVTIKCPSCGCRNAPISIDQYKTFSSVDTSAKVLVGRSWVSGRGRKSALEQGPLLFLQCASHASA